MVLKTLSPGTMPPAQTSLWHRLPGGPASESGLYVTYALRLRLQVLIPLVILVASTGSVYACYGRVIERSRLLLMRRARTG